VIVFFEEFIFISFACFYKFSILMFVNILFFARNLLICL